MKDGPDIARVASLIGDPARANILSALMDGRALTVTELAASAGVTVSTTSLHLRKLEEGGLVEPAKQGRHRYFALAGPQVAEVLEALMGLAQHTGAVRVRTGPRDEELRHARLCYDHLAGEKGVAVLDSLKRRKLLAGDNLDITENGRVFFLEFGIDLAALENGRRKMCRSCLDWSMRRDHLAGALGSALWNRMQELGWVHRADGSRVVTFTQDGARAFERTFSGGGVSAGRQVTLRNLGDGFKPVGRW